MPARYLITGGSGFLGINLVLSCLYLVGITLLVIAAGSDELDGTTKSSLMLLAVAMVVFSWIAKRGVLRRRGRLVRRPPSRA